MRRINVQAVTLVTLFVLLGSACRSRSRQQPIVTGAPTWRFGVPRGTSSELGEDGLSPIQLTASDGTGLELVSLDAKIAIEGPLALTELTMSFANPLDRTLEGRFNVVLPAGAAVNRFALRLPGGWQEAEVVEKQAARVAYEDFLHRRQDPALLEKAPGNEFSARVFPIAPRAVKQIKLSYAQELPSVDEPYQLRLRGLPLVPALQILAYAGETAVRVARKHFTPDADFLLERPHAASGLQSGALVVARLRPPLPASPSPMAGLLVLLDTSASRTSGLARQVADLEKLIAALQKAHGDSLPLQIAAFDQEVVPLYAGTAGGFATKSRALRDQLTARGALGASDLAGALAWAARTTTANHQRLLLITDGVATTSASAAPVHAEEAGDDALALGRAADGLKTRFDRLDVVLVGGIHDDDAMRSLVTHHLSQDGVVVDSAAGIEQLVERLSQTTRSGIKLSVRDAAWVWPAQVDGLQRGDDLIVYAQMHDDRPRDAASVVLSGLVDLEVEVPLASPKTVGLRPLVERAWARARIASLGAEAAALGETARDRANALRQQIVELSTRHRVLSDYTALLVLEQEADYARFHIDRRALSDILVVDDTGLHLEHRRDAVLPTSEPAQADRDKQRLDTLMAKSRSLAESEDSAPAEEEAPAGQEETRYYRITGGARERIQGPEAEFADGVIQGHVEGVAGGVIAIPPPPPPAPPPATARPAVARPPAPSSARLQHLSTHGYFAPLAEPDSRAQPRRRPAPQGVALQGATLGFTVTGHGAGGGGLAEPPPDSGAPAWNGQMLEVMNLVMAKKLDPALAQARAWHDREPGDVLALVALGNVWRAQGQLAQAGRAYGSIIDLFPGRADLRRFAGDLLESLGNGGEALAADDFAHVVRDRPDHPNSHRLYAYALLRTGHLPAAFAAIEAGVKHSYPSGRFLGVDRILRDDAGLIAAAWLHVEPKQRAELEKRLAELGATLPTQNSLRLVLSWETDANDVDFHIRDRAGQRAWYSQPHLASGGDLYADVTTGYGPECFTIEGQPTAYPYQIQAHYYSRGPMGYGMGKVEIIEHDGKGGLRFDQRPFVVMNDAAYVDLGTIPGPLATR